MSTNDSAVRQLRQRRSAHTRGYIARMVALSLLVAALWVASLMVGETFYSITELVALLRGEVVPGASFTVTELRLPRATIGVAVGMAFGMAGVTFQTLLRNQLASPDIIGISAAASAAGVTAIVLFHASTAVVSLSSLAASLATAALIYLLSAKSGVSGARLILIGIGIGSMLQSWTLYVLSKAAAWDMPTATRWLTGSLNNVAFDRGWVALATVALAIVLAAIFSHRAALLQLGDDLAYSWGIPAAGLRAGLLLAAVFLVAIATATGGPIAFVAFMSGPIAMRLFRPGPALILPAGLIGAALVLAADMAAHYAFGTRYPVGVITGALGAPFLIYLLLRTRR